MIGIYKITSPSNKIYIGQSINIKRRFLGYKNGWHKQKTTKLFGSFKKYGVDNHLFEIVLLCDKKDLNLNERYYQEFFDACGPNGLNLMLTSVYDRSGKMSKESVAKMSQKLLGNSRKKGWVMPKEVKDKLSLSKKGCTPWNRGIARTCEEKKLMSVNRCGIMLGEDNFNSKLILNLETGIFYYGAKEAAESCTNFKHHNLKDRFRGKVFNNSPFIQA
jgi:group I intron endonuclease